MQFSIYTVAIVPPWVVMPRVHESGHFQGSYGQPRETTQHLLGPIWATFRPTKFKTYYIAKKNYFSADCPNCAKISFIKMCTYFSFVLIVWDIPNSVTPQNTLHMVLVLLVLPCTHQCRRSPVTLFLSCPGQRNRRRQVPVSMTGVRYNSLL